MGKDEELGPSWQEKLLFYTTTFFVLLGTFSLFAFLFLVPFVIDPAFTTIFMEFDETPAHCVTVGLETRQGASNCSWSSCREGCTKDIFDCTQIRVNYKRGIDPTLEDFFSTTLETFVGDEDQIEKRETKPDNYDQLESSFKTNYIDEKSELIEKRTRLYNHSDIVNGETSERMRLYNNSKLDNGKDVQKRDVKSFISNYDDDSDEKSLIHYESMNLDMIEEKNTPNEDDYNLLDEEVNPTGLQPNNSEWYYTGARLFPNVKGCGYPPILNCSIFLKIYKEIGTNFTCFYSRVDPGLVISELDMWQTYMNLVYAMAIPIPSFIISVIYLTIAYFKIYNEDDETELLQENDEEVMDMDGVEIGCSEVPMNASESAVPAPSETLTPGSEVFREDLASFGHQFKVAMADEVSRESLTVPMSNSISIPGNICKTMTTSISTPAGVISEL